MNIKRIAFKLICWFLIIAVLPLALVSLLAQSNAERSLRNQFENHLHSIADNKAQQIHVFFQERVEDAITLAKMPSIAEIIKKLSENDSNARSLAQESAPADSNMRAFLSSYIETAGYESLYLISADGITVFTVSQRDGSEVQLNTSDDTASELIKVTDRAATLLEPSLSEVIKDPQTLEPARFLAAPIIQDGSVLGVVALQMSHREINAVVQDFTGLGRTGEVVVGSKIGNEVVFVTPLRHDLDAAFRRRIELGSDSGIPMQAAVQGRKGHGLSTDYRNKQVVAVWEYVPSFRWGMVIKIDSEEAFAPLKKLRNQSFMIGIIAVLMVFGIAVVVSRSISHPITLLTGSVQRIASGFLDERATIASDDEIGELATEFNHMAEQLSKNIEQISAQEIRTKTILNSTADGLITIDESGNVRSFNAAAEKLFDCDAANIVGRDVGRVSSALKQLIVSTDTIHGEIEIEGRSQDDHKIPLALRLTEMVCQDERLFIATLQDVSQRKQTEIERERLFAGIQDAVKQLSAASQSILASTAQQAKYAQQQAALVSETTGAVEEIAQTSEQDSARAEEVADSARRADDVGQSGRDAVRATIAAMQNVRTESESTAKSILSLSERAQAIDEIVGAVNEIAEQTNVLALNAAIEASRAGEYGKGFSVVASEVKSLAKKSKKSTQQIRKILGTILDATNQAVLSTELGANSIAEASKVISHADVTINTLSETISDAARTTAQIVASSKQQTTAMAQISEAMTHADQAAQQTLAATRQAEQLAKDLNVLGDQLIDLMQQNNEN